MYSFFRAVRSNKQITANIKAILNNRITYIYSNGYSSTFILLIFIFQVPHLFEGLWYDEAALVENVKNSPVNTYFLGLNWLQTVPFGYFLVSKVFFLTPYGLLVCRLFSLLFLVLSIILVDKNLIQGRKNPNLRYAFLFLSIVNSASIRYGTDVKPYTLELFLSILSFLVVKRQLSKKIILVILLLPFFSSTGFVLMSASLLASCVIHKKLKYVLLSLYNLAFTLLVSMFVPLTTRSQMHTAWFGSEKSFTFDSFKGAIGNLLWYATSGFGLLSDNLGSPNSYFISATLTTIIGLVIIYYFKFELLHITLVLSAFIIIFLQFGHFVPIAGRLFLGFSSLVIFLFLSSLTTKALKVISVVAICFALLVNSNSLKFNKSRISIKPIDFDVNSKIYSDLNLGPEVKFTLGNSSYSLQDNLILDVKNGNIYTCKVNLFLKGDIAFLSYPFVSNLSHSKFVSNLKVTERTEVFAKVKFLSNFKSIQPNSWDSYFECNYIFRNPSKPKF